MRLHSCGILCHQLHDILRGSIAGFLPNIGLINGLAGPLLGAVGPKPVLHTSLKPYAIKRSLMAAIN